MNVRFTPHRLFRVVDHDLFIDLPVSVSEAALGATVKVPTLEGAVNLKVPEGITSGQKLRISKRGLPRHNREHGDLYAVAQIVVPAKLSDKERELFKVLSEVSTFNPRAHFD